MKPPRSDAPTLIVLGGFAGTGKTTLAKRLSSELGFPRLGSDSIGRTIRRSEGLEGATANAYWIAYDVLFALCEEFLRSGVSVIVDTNMGWAFQWQRLDSIKERNPKIVFLPIVLRCPREICLKRIQMRHTESPAYYDPPELFVTDPKILRVWDFLENLNRPDLHVVDAARPLDEVYQKLVELTPPGSDSSPHD